MRIVRHWAAAAVRGLSRALRSLAEPWRPLPRPAPAPRCPPRPFAARPGYIG